MVVGELPYVREASESYSLKLVWKVSSFTQRVRLPRLRSDASIFLPVMDVPALTVTWFITHHVHFCP